MKGGGGEEGRREGGKVECVERDRNSRGQKAAVHSS
jgi:hypothetical protein